MLQQEFLQPVLHQSFAIVWKLPPGEELRRLAEPRRSHARGGRRAGPGPPLQSTGAGGGTADRPAGHRLGRGKRGTRGSKWRPGGDGKSRSDNQACAVRQTRSANRSSPSSPSPPFRLLLSLCMSPFALSHLPHSPPLALCQPHQATQTATLTHEGIMGRISCRGGGRGQKRMRLSSGGGRRGRQSGRRKYRGKVNRVEQETIGVGKERGCGGEPFVGARRSLPWTTLARFLASWTISNVVTDGSYGRRGAGPEGLVIIIRRDRRWRPAVT